MKKIEPGKNRHDMYWNENTRHQNNKIKRFKKQKKEKYNINNIDYENIKELDKLYE